MSSIRLPKFHQISEVFLLVEPKSRKLLEAKSKWFNSLKIREQQYLLYAALTGEETDESKKLTDTAKHQLIIARVIFFAQKLEKLEKYKEWLSRSESFDYFMKAPLEEKEKYHNAMSKFLDEMEEENLKNKEDSPLSSESVLDSSPTAQAHRGEGFPDLDDKTKFEKQK